jgi:hypothetical protein
MPRAVAEGREFVNATEYAIKQFFEVISLRHKAKAEIAERCEELKKHIESEMQSVLTADKNLRHPENNYLEYARRVEYPTHHLLNLALAGGSAHEAAYRDKLAFSDATHAAIEVAAGAVLQVGKQALSFRYGSKTCLSVLHSRCIGSQSVLDIVWEGRNHAMHWEEVEPKPAVEKMLAALQADRGAAIRPGVSNAVVILDCLGWRDAQTTVAELLTLMDLKPVEVGIS